VRMKRLPIADCRITKSRPKQNMNKDELKARTKQFALRIMNLVDALPNSTKGRVIGNQLIRSGTAVGANYRACCRSRSKAEFVAKIGIVEEEADESGFWMELIVDGKILAEAKVKALLSEANELVAIMAASRISASRNR
jgi:four helix bundle protein